MVKHIDATRDYTGFYAPHIDPGLKNFSYSEQTRVYAPTAAENPVLGARKDAYMYFRYVRSRA